MIDTMLTAVTQCGSCGHPGPHPVLRTTPGSTLVAECRCGDRQVTSPPAVAAGFLAAVAFADPAGLGSLLRDMFALIGKVATGVSDEETGQHLRDALRRASYQALRP